MYQLGCPLRRLLFSAFGPVVDFSDDLRLLQKQASLIWGELLLPMYLMVGI